MTTGSAAGVSLNKLRWKAWRLEQVITKIGELRDRGELDGDAQAAITEALQESAERKTQ